MPNQRALAETLGMSQSTVSLALRDDPSIPEQTRQIVKDAAERIGYRPNPYVASVMTRIRLGRKPKDKGCIALIVDMKDWQTWFSNIEPYREMYEGITQRADELGYYAECFYLRATGMSPAAVERILAARGIKGLILVGPRARPLSEVSMDWSRYASGVIAYDWNFPGIHRVATHHRHNVDLAYRTLRERGFTRIGMSLPQEALEGVDANWISGYLLWESRCPRQHRIPLFLGKPGEVPVSKFAQWLERWKPQALLTVQAHEADWLNELKIRVPEELYVACVARRPRGCAAFPGVDENLLEVGRSSVDVVVAQLLHNEFGLPKFQKISLIEGTWRDPDPSPATHRD